MAASQHVFPYQYIDNTKFLRPYIPVKLRSQKITTQPLLAMLDSGADFCVFDSELSDLLKIALYKTEKIKLTGINGSAIGHVAHIEIGVKDKFIACPVIFSSDFSPLGYSGLIGQIGFFDNFLVTFDRANKQILLR